MNPFKFLRKNGLRTHVYWKGDIRYTILMPEDINDDYEIGYYIRGWMDAHYNLPRHNPSVFHEERTYAAYGLGYYNYQLTQRTNDTI